MARTGNPKRVKNQEEIELIRNSSRLVARTLGLMDSIARPGITTRDLDRAAEDFIRSEGGIPSFKGYRGFPAAICASVNDQVVHGIPGKRVLKDGDIVSIDVGVLKEGYHGDGAATFAIGEISEPARKLMETTRRSLMAGVEQAVSGNKIREISRAIQTEVENQGFSVVRDLVGHGIGKEMHEEPQVPNFVIPGESLELLSGMTLAIEPMVNIGNLDVTMDSDGWTVITMDGTLSAHFEHTVLVGDGRAEILTRDDKREA